MELHELIAKRLAETLEPRDALIDELSRQLAESRKQIDDLRKSLDAFHIPQPESPPTVQDVAKAVLDSEYLVTVVDTVACAYLQENPPAAGKDAGPISDTMIKSAVSEYLKENPLPKGDKGKDAEPVTDEQLYQAVAKYVERNPVEKGKDGIGLAGAMIDRNGELLVTMTNGEVKSLGPVVGRDGDDAVGFDDMSATSDGEGGVLLKFSRGDNVKEFPLNFAIPVYRGYWREGRSVKEGHIITNDGQSWIALRDTTAKPCFENKEDYALMVRKGRDGETVVKTVTEGPRKPVALGGV